MNWIYIRYKMAEDCSAGFALFPILMVFVFISILSRAFRAAGGGGGVRVSYGGPRAYFRPRYYGSGFYALQYLAQQSSYRSYDQPGYAPPYTPPSSYRTQPYPGQSSPAYGPAYGGAPPPAYTTGPGAGYQAPPPPAYSRPPAPEAPKVPCSYCGSLNPSAERNCLLCGAPMK